VKHLNQANKVEPWETTLADLLNEREDDVPALDVKDILDAIHSHISLKECIYTVPIHCEAALASLALAAHNLPVADVKNHSLLAEVLQVMFFLCHSDAHQSDVMHRTWIKPSSQCQSDVAQFVGALGCAEA
jgi:CO dehydrogenase/acetyl-CoA synthase gamma subunit (corrinoid Fe-S protein)